ncbi:N-acetyltransferase [Vibrio makurazakiensis]|uniref:GNAT family N-acetyltransferase n=1 Tax=Vibrio makurazakiensis TaxID=2910250 RepID=UPI003D09D3A0
MEKVVWYKEKCQFNVELAAGYYAKVQYKLIDDAMHITSTRVPDELQGKGYGKVMMESVLPVIEQEGYKVVPICSYVVHFMNRSTKWSHLLSKSN